jgi:hypothetical protein
MASVLNLVGMGNDALLSEVERLVKANRALSATLLVHLGEVDARKLYLARGYSSMFEYCRSALGMSEAEAYLRMRAASIGRRFPLVLDRFGSGGVHLSAIKLLAPHLTEENHAQLLDRVRGMTKREIEVLVAELSPKPDVPARMRKLPDRALKPAAAFDFSAQQACDAGSSQGSRAATANAPDIVVAVSASTPSACLPPFASTPSASLPPSASTPSAPLPPFAAPKTAAAPSSATASAIELRNWPALPTTEPATRAFALQPLPARASTTPLSPGRFKLELTLGQDAHDQLLQLQALFRHQNPSGDLTSIVERALRELLERTMARRFAQTRASAKHVAHSLNAHESAGDEQDQRDAPGDAREEDGRALSNATDGTRDKDDTAFAHPPGAARDHDASLRDAPREMSDEHARANAPGEACDDDYAASAHALGRACDEDALLRDAPGSRREGDERASIVARDENTEAEMAAGAEDPASSLKSRYVPRAVLSAVFARDAGQCTFVSPEGRRCSAREFLEVHHHAPFARGGEATVDNLRLSCRAHNQFLAELEYGRGYVRQKISEAQHAARSSRPR